MKVIEKLGIYQEKFLKKLFKALEQSWISILKHCELPVDCLAIKCTFCSPQPIFLHSNICVGRKKLMFWKYQTEVLRLFRKKYKSLRGLGCATYVRVSNKSGKSGKSKGILFFLEKSGILDKSQGKVRESFSIFR